MRIAGGGMWLVALGCSSTTLAQDHHPAPDASVWTGVVSEPGGPPLDQVAVLTAQRAESVSIPDWPALRERARQGLGPAVNVCTTGSGIQVGKTDATGRFAVSLDPPNRYGFLLCKAGFAPSVGHGRLIYDMHGRPSIRTHHPPEVQLLRYRSIEVAVRTDAGAPVSRALVAVHGLGNNWVYYHDVALTDENGLVAVSVPVSSKAAPSTCKRWCRQARQGTIVIAAFHADLGEQRWESPAEALPESFEFVLAPMETVTVRPSCRIAGSGYSSRYFADGSPPASSHFFFVNGSGRVVASRRVAKLSGSWDARLPRADYDLVVMGACGYGRLPVNLRVGDIDVAMPMAGHLLTVNRRRALKPQWVELFGPMYAQAWLEPSGPLHFRGLLAGRYSVHWNAGQSFTHVTIPQPGVVKLQPPPLNKRPKS